ncbi:carbon-nitrogen family hydrolase [Acidaminococcus sp. LBK-2]|uniref:carbon-nitrogen family hydrolase n=1 Tax=Acidaminococcus sp. LBK-2 TaxID=3456956 RepID=UPI003FA4903E
MTNFALLQTDIAFCDAIKNYEKVTRMFEEAMQREPKPDVVVLPEDWASGFSDEMFHHMEDFIENENGESVRVLQQLAEKYSVWVVGGSIGTMHSDGKMRNTTFLIDRTGKIVGDYSKMHLYSDMDEDFPYEHGNKTEVFDTELGKLGFMICYDIRFCELSRIYALKKADVLVVTSNFPNPRVNHWRTLLIARAIENQMYIVACNRVGASPMGTYCGHSIIIDPWGDIIAEGSDSEEIITGSIDYKYTQEVRSTIHMFRDRQPQFYNVLTEKNRA